MYRIAICDDELRVLKDIAARIQQITTSIETECELNTYTSGTELLDDMSVREFDAVFIDIEMDGKNGIEISKEIVNKDFRCYIIYISNRDDMAADTIRFRPFWFIRKKKMGTELEECVKKLFSVINDEQVIVCEGKEQYQVRVNDIIYFEACGHYINVNTNKGQLQMREKMNVLENRCADYGFIRVHKGFLVNVKYIFSINGRGCVLMDKTVIPISRGKIDELNKQMMRYQRRYVYGIS